MADCTSKENEGFGDDAFDDGLIFLNDRGHSMHFVLLMDNATERDALRRRLKNRLGCVHTSVDDIGPHSIVLTDDCNKNWKHDKVERFRIGYITECFDNSRIADINRFMWDKSDIYKTSLDYMDIVFDRVYSWHTIPDFFRKPSNGEEVDSNFVYDFDNDRRPSDSEETGSKADTDSDSFMDICSEPPPRNHKKNTRSFYSRAEKEAIVKFIVDKKYYDRVKGNEVWKELERLNVCPIRTWRSLKNHAVKSIPKDIHTFTWLTPKQSKQLYNALSKPRSLTR